MTMETKLVLVGGALVVALLYGLRVLVAWRERQVRQLVQASPSVSPEDRVPCGFGCCPYLATETLWHKALMKPVDYCLGHAAETLVRGMTRIMGNPRHVVQEDRALGIYYCTTCGESAPPWLIERLSEARCPGYALSTTY